MSHSLFRRASASLAARLSMCVVGLLAWAAPARADWVPGKRMSEACVQVMSQVRALTNRNNNIGYADGVSIMAAYLARAGATVNMRVQLTANQKYTFVGGGDSGTDDLDLEILDRNGRVLAQDTDADATPLVVFSPRTSGEYTIRAKLYKPKGNNGAFCLVAILRDGGWNVPVANLGAAVGRMISLCEQVDKATMKRVTFHDAQNQWAVYGAVLRSGSDASINTLTLGRGRRVLVTAGDNFATDLDNYFLDSTGREMAKDDGSAATAICGMDAFAGSTYSIKFKHAAGKGPSLVMTAILDIAD